LSAPIRTAALGLDGQPRVTTLERDRVEIRLDADRAALKSPKASLATGLATEAHYDGYLVVDGQLRELPVGSSFDPVRGAFYWQPGLGYVGNYDLLFVKTNADGGRERIPVRVAVQDRPSVALASRLSGPWTNVRFDR
jgi:hypothetical protein